MVNMLDIALFITLQVQKVLLLLSYWLCRPFVKQEEDVWMVGVVEIANIPTMIAGAFERSYLVNLSPHKFYASNKYDFDMRKFGFFNILPVRLVVGPVLLGYLANRIKNFFYVGDHGYLIHLADGREFEFSFLKKAGKQIVTYFCGTDIRSPALSITHAKENNIDVMATYQVMVAPQVATAKREKYLEKLAASTDRYADHIFNAPVDNFSYIKRTPHPILNFYPDERFIKNDAKFSDMKKIRIAHAPSSPFIKGTQIVRAAIKKLQLEGYDFEYVEFINMPNTAVIAYLNNAHIVVNELYAFVPGIFGIEAMAAHCALITSADRNMEPTLAEGANEAWLMTKYWQMYDHLKLLLGQPELIKKYADSGYEWAHKNCRTSQAREQLKILLGKAA